MIILWLLCRQLTTSLLLFFSTNINLIFMLPGTIFLGPENLALYMLILLGCANMCFRFSMENLYHVVSHVEDYKYFVPWCRDSTVNERKDGHVKCKLVIGFPPLVERYISVLTLVPHNLVVVSRNTTNICYLHD